MRKHLTTSKQLNKMGGRANNSGDSGISAPDRLGDFFISDFFGSAENTKQLLAGIISGDYYRLVSSRNLDGIKGNTNNEVIDMTKDVIPFNFNQFSVRTVKIGDEPYFCLRDACDVLGVKNSNDRQFKEGVEKIYTLTNGGQQEVVFINEPNLYRLIFRSNKPQAQAFADWVYNEVLPSIRKTGSYGTPAPVQVDMKAIGGMVKKCCAVAVRDELNHLIADDFESDNWQKIIALMLTNRVNHLMEAKKQELITLIKQ